MAIAYIAAGTPAAANSTTISPGLPAGISADDFGLVLALSRATGGQTLSDITGWPGQTQANNGLDTLAGTLRTRAFSRVFVGGDSAPAVVCTGSQLMIGAILAFSGVDPTTPVHQIATATGTNDASAGNVTAPTVTTTIDGCMIVRGYITCDNVTHSAWSAGTQAINTTSTLGSDASLSITYELQASQGATGTATVNVTAAEDSGRGNWLAYTIALAPASTSGDPTDPGVGWTHMTQLSQDYALLPGEEPAGGDPGWGTKAYLPNTVTSGTWVRYRGTGTTEISAVSNLGVISFEDAAGPFEFEFDFWDGTAWEDTATAFEFAFDTFGGIIQDLFTAANDTDVNARSPTQGSGTWADAKLNTSSPDPTLNVTIQSNRLSCPEDQNGVEYTIGTTDFTATFDWVIQADAPETFSNYICFRREDGANWLNINCRRANGDIRLQRRLAGTTATLTSATGLTWSAGTTYSLTIQCILNSVKIYRDGTLLIDTTVDTNQGASATKFALMAAGGASASTPIQYDNLEIFDEFTLLEPQVLSIDNAIPEFGATINVAIAPAGEVPNAITFGGVSIFADVTSLTSSGFAFVTPALTDYLPAADFESVNFVEGATITVGFATADDLEIFVAPQSDVAANESGADVWFGEAPSAGIDEFGEPLAPAGIFDGMTIDQGYLIVVTGGGIDSISQAGVIETTDGDLTADYYRFTTAWTAQDELVIGVPTLNAARIAADGLTIKLYFSEPVTISAGEQTTTAFALTASGGALTMEYESGSGSSVAVYTLSRVPDRDEAITLDYTTAADNIEDSFGFDLQSIADLPVKFDAYLQSLFQGAVRLSTETSRSFNEDFITLMHTDLSVTSGNYNELLIRWLQLKLASATTSLPALQAEAAADRGVSRWQEITDPTSIGT